MGKNYFDELRKLTLTKEQIEVRIADVEANGFTLVAYKTRNADKNILDRIVGPENWQKGHNGNPHNCYIEIWDPEKNMWIHKDNFGESADRSTKGSATDSMKRAGEDWGIGRELYTCPRIFIESPTVEVNYGSGYDIPNDVRTMYDKENIVVKEFEATTVDDAKVVSKISLAFVNGNVFFEWDRKDPGKKVVKKVSSEIIQTTSEEPAVSETPSGTSELNTPEGTPEASPAPVKEIKKTPAEEATSSPASNDPSSEVLLETNAAQNQSAKADTPNVAELSPIPSPAPAAVKETVDEFTAIDEHIIAQAEPVQNNNVSPQDVVFELLDGYDPDSQGLRVYQGKTMGQLLEEFPNVINLIASPTFKWEAKMKKEIWEAAKETIRLSRM